MALRQKLAKMGMDMLLKMVRGLDLFLQSAQSALSARRLEICFMHFQFLQPENPNYVTGMNDSVLLTRILHFDCGMLALLILTLLPS